MEPHDVRNVGIITISQRSRRTTVLAEIEAIGYVLQQDFCGVRRTAEDLLMKGVGIRDDFVAQPPPILKALAFPLLEVELLGYLLQVPSPLDPDEFAPHRLEVELLDVLMHLVTYDLQALPQSFLVFSELLAPGKGPSSQSLFVVRDRLDAQLHLLRCVFLFLFRDANVLLPQLHVLEEQLEVVLGHSAPALHLQESRTGLAMKLDIIFPVPIRHSSPEVELAGCSSGSL